MCLAQADTLIQLNVDGYNDCQMLIFGTECVIDSTHRQVINIRILAMTYPPPLFLGSVHTNRDML